MLITDRLYYDAEAGAASGPTGDAATGTNSGAGAGQPGGQPPAQGANATQQAAPNQADVVSMPRGSFNERLQQERNAGVRELLAALGFEAGTPDALAKAREDLAGLLAFARQQKAATQTAEERLAEQMSALEKRVQAAEERAAAAERERDEARAALQSRVRREAILRAAARARHPEDVVTWAESQRPDLVGQLLREDGTVDDEVARTIVAECAKARREWFVAPVGVPSNHEGRAPSSLSELERKLELARQTARSLLR
jgi:hypothetical protein